MWYFVEFGFWKYILEILFKYSSGGIRGGRGVNNFWWRLQCFQSRMEVMGFIGVREDFEEIIVFREKVVEFDEKYCL